MHSEDIGSYLPWRWPRQTPRPSGSLPALIAGDKARSQVQLLPRTGTVVAWPLGAPSALSICPLCIRLGELQEPSVDLERSCPARLSTSKPGPRAPQSRHLSEGPVFNIDCKKHFKICFDQNANLDPTSQQYKLWGVKNKTKKKPINSVSKTANNLIMK